MTGGDHNKATDRHGWRRYQRWALAIGAFLILAGVVFLVSENRARKTAVGFPDFADSPFILTDQTGVERRNADFAGQPLALFFGFTFCPDVCPTTLMSLSGALDSLAEAGVSTGKLTIIFITVDPERDTPEQLRDYLSLFDLPVTGLTGDATALADARRAFGAFAEKVETADGDFTFDHSAAVYLYDSGGRFSGTIIFNEPAEFIMEKLRRLLQ